MTDLRAAAQQALEAMLNFPSDISDEMFESIRSLKAALAEFSPDWDRIEPLQENLREHMAEIQRLRAKLATGDNLSPTEPVQEPVEPVPAKESGLDRFLALAEAAGVTNITPEFADRLTARCTQIKHAVQEPVAWVLALPDGRLDRLSVVAYDDEAEEMLQRSIAGCTLVPLYTAPPQRKPEPRTKQECFDPACACRGGPCAECPEGEREKEISDLRFSLEFYKRRADALQIAQRQMRDPERTMVCDVLANGCLLAPAGDRYTAPPQRKPLSEEEIDKAYREIWADLPSDFDHTSAGWIEEGIRYAERAHGITP